MVANRIIVGTAVTFVLFFAEAFLHYSIGKGKFVIPEPRELGLLLGTILIASILSNVITQYINHNYLAPPKRILKPGHPLRKEQGQTSSST